MNKIRDDEDDSLELASKSWGRLMDNMNKAGYRDGMEEASQAVLQADFDKGYSEGFHIAFILGKYKGLANVELNDIKHPKEICEILENCKGICHLCELDLSNGTMQNEPENLIHSHREHVSKVLHILFSYFYTLLKDRGIDISNLKYK